MLYIEEKHSKSGVIYESQWHIGEHEPTFTSRVVTFQADGDELMLIIEAIRKASCNQ